MKILIYTLALISAFFVSSAPDMSDLKPPKMEDKDLFQYSCRINKTDCPRLEAPQGSDSQALEVLADTFLSSLSSGFVEGCVANNIVSTGGKNYNINAVCTFGNEQGTPQEWTATQNSTISVSFIGSNSIPVCPPNSYPNYNILVTSDSGQKMCAKEFIPEPEPCSEFGNNSFLPNKSGVGQAGENACYTNPTTGQQCQFKQGHDNFIATGKSCDGDENDYGDKPTPEPTPDGGDDNCYNYGSQGQVLICDVDPNEGCNAIVVSGQQQYQCPAGCGSMDGVYFCTYDDKDGDGKPDDKNQNGVPDKDETCENGRCKPNTPDNENPNPTPENPDMTSTNNRLDNISGELSFIGGKINKTNQTLDGINSGIQGIKQGQDKSNGLLTGVEKNTKLTADNTDVIAGNTKGILDSISETDIGDSFNPEGSSSFYESSYENGWQGVWDEKSDLIGQTGLFVFLKQFRLTSGGSAPEMNICFDVLVNLGCKTLDPNWERLMPFLRICIFITAAFVCRRIIFGG
ncbi:hypothetical protein ACNSN2_18840 [Pseudoalteromonas sp. US3C1013]|uniref:hypothetical protein n=1 Tax=unclassified Pseudoalteromonas TaxID=194690 RepID=UPI003AB58C08